MVIRNAGRDPNVIETRRVYGEKQRAKGFRILVDRVWPRGLKKEQVKADLWLRDIAPSTELRQWYRHDEAKWDEFRKRYWRELRDRKQDIDVITAKDKEGKVILLYGARDVSHNNAVALKEYLDSGKTGKKKKEEGKKNR